jgi:hypothetical protein
MKHLWTSTTLAFTWNEEHHKTAIITADLHAKTMKTGAPSIKQKLNY